MPAGTYTRNRIKKKGDSLRAVLFSIYSILRRLV
nr:MAG TPA: hypothetical protein [Caudoviricetes sp.]